MKKDNSLFFFFFLTIVSVVVVGAELVVAVLRRTVVRLGVRINESAFTLELDHRFARGGGLLLQVRFFELLDGLDTQLGTVVEEVLTKPIPAEEAQAPIRAPFPEL